MWEREEMWKSRGREGVCVCVCEYEVGGRELRELKDEQAAAETFMGTWGSISVVAAV